MLQIWSYNNNYHSIHMFYLRSLPVARFDWWLYLWILCRQSTDYRKPVLLMALKIMLHVKLCLCLVIILLICVPARIQIVLGQTFGCAWLAAATVSLKAGEWKISTIIWLPIESLVARGQARLFGVAGSNPPGSVSTSLFDSSVSVSLIHAYGGITPCV